jgi:hypothetical protein
MKGAVIVWAVIVGIHLLVVLIRDGEDKKPSKYSFCESACDVVVSGWLLWWGGFFS